MIYTVTFNPSLDYIVRLDSFTAGKIKRVNYEQVLAGGKGINVSIVLQNLGQKSTALGFLAGFTGEEIKSQLSSFGVKSDFVQLKNGFSRINVKAKAEIYDIMRRCWKLSPEERPPIKTIVSELEVILPNYYP